MHGRAFDGALAQNMLGVIFNYMAAHRNSSEVMESFDRLAKLCAVVVIQAGQMQDTIMSAYLLQIVDLAVPPGCE